MSSSGASAPTIKMANSLFRSPVKPFGVGICCSKWLYVGGACECWPVVSSGKTCTVATYKNVPAEKSIAIPVAFTEFNVSFCSWPIPKYVKIVNNGADKENIAKCLRILCLQINETFHFVKWFEICISLNVKLKQKIFTVQFLRAVKS